MVALDGDGRIRFLNAPAEARLGLRSGDVEGTPIGDVLAVMDGEGRDVTQALLERSAADAAPASVRATAFGIFHLVTGVATLAASVLAGWLWEAWGPPATFWAGASTSA